MSALEKLDDKAFSRFHVLAMFTTGMGVFTDGYDLSSIGLVLPLVLASFGIDHVSGLQSGFLTGAALVGSAVGAVVFGALAQKGRKRYYGIDVGIMAAAAAAQAFAPNLWTLIAIRFVLGIGVGADYVLSPTIMAEHANRADRGKKLGFGFAGMWGFGAIASALVLLALQRAGVSP
ncbi:MAG: MFS transporter, partial [Acidobacteriota bacterium]